MLNYFNVIAGAVVVSLLGGAQAYSAPEACTLLRTFQDVDNIRNDLAGSYCLSRDIDLSPFANFNPIAGFAGTLDGNGHVLRNLKVTALQDAGLFIVLSGTVKNLGIINAKVTGGASAGILAGTTAPGAVIDLVYTTGMVTVSGSNSLAGGLVGLLNESTIDRSLSTATVQGPTGGGLVGLTFSNSSISRSFAAGRVVAAFGGGLVGNAQGTVHDSFAMGPAQAGFAFGCGSASLLKRTYTVGRVGINGAGFTAGPCGGTLVRSYWDVQTSGQVSSPSGTPITTTSLQRRLLLTFSPTTWAITPNVTYPYLNIPEMWFHGPLAALVRNQKLYTFMPIGQRERAEYSDVLAMKGSKSASLAAVYAMIGRAIALTDNVASLLAVKVDAYWNGKKAIWQGAVTEHATLGTFSALPGPIDETNIIGQIRNRKAVIIRGTYAGPNGPINHWMLATSFVTDDQGNVTSLIANDPWLGRQVHIDPTTKTVSSPATFPLAEFAVTAFVPVTLN